MCEKILKNSIEMSVNNKIAGDLCQNNKARAESSHAIYMQIEFAYKVLYASHMVWRGAAQRYNENVTLIFIHSSFLIISLRQPCVLCLSISRVN